MQDDSLSHDGSDSIDWNTDDEMEIANISPSSSVALSTNGAVKSEYGEVAYNIRTQTLLPCSTSTLAVIVL